TLEFQSQSAAGLRAFHEAAAIAPLFIDEPTSVARFAMRRGEFAEADRLLETSLRNSTRNTRFGFLWLRAISLRNQGRLQDALATARQLRDLGAVGRDRATGPPFDALMQAIALFEAGRAREAAVLFDSLGESYSLTVPSVVARGRCWMFTHEATALAAAGDTGRLAALADTVYKLGPQS